MAACFRLVSPLKIPEEEEEEEEEEKGCLMVMADPSDHGHGKNRWKENQNVIKFVMRI